MAVPVSVTENFTNNITNDDISLQKPNELTVKNSVEQGQTNDKTKQQKLSEHLPTSKIGRETMIMVPTHVFIEMLFTSMNASDKLNIKCQ